MELKMRVNADVATIEKFVYIGPQQYTIAGLVPTHFGKRLDMSRLECR